MQQVLQNTKLTIYDQQQFCIPQKSRLAGC